VHLPARPASNPGRARPGHGDGAIAAPLLASAQRIHRKRAFTIAKPGAVVRRSAFLTVSTSTREARSIGTSVCTCSSTPCGTRTSKPPSAAHTCGPIRRPHRMADPPGKLNAVRHRRHRTGEPSRRVSLQIRPPDVVYIEPGEEHWHGAKPTRFMAHIAMKKPTTTVKSSPIRLPPRGVTPAASTRLAVVGNRGVAVVKDAASEHKNSTMAASFSRRPSRPFGSHLVMVIPVLRGYCSCFVPFPSFSRSFSASCQYRAEHRTFQSTLDVCSDLDIDHPHRLRFRLAGRACRWCYRGGEGRVLIRRQCRVVVHEHSV